MSICPDCKNEFLQPFVCSTCGAEKLYDATLKEAQSKRAALRTKLEEAERILEVLRGELVLTLAAMEQARAEGMEEAAKVVDPVGPRPCDCETCYCQNTGDLAAVTAWDSEASMAKSIRAKMKEGV